VRATRAQADRILYKAAIREMLESQPNLWLFQQAVDDLMVEGDRVVGAVTQVGIQFKSKTVVLTAGTFLDGKIHVGLDNYAAGRAGDPPAVTLSARLKELKLPQGRLKTGTPPRIDGRSIDFSQCTEQPGDGMPGGVNEGHVPVFSFRGHATCTRARCLAGSRTPTSARTRSSAAALTAAPCSPARSRAWAHATAPAWKTRSTGLPTRTATRSSWSPKG
jgi:tRNA uridine 5-carboxymethylaminomethyl modification enzyme